MSRPGWIAGVETALAPLGGRVVAGGPLGAITTYRVGGPAALRVTVVDRAELALVARAVAESGAPLLVVGRGSNMLVSDSGFAGVAVLLDAESFGQVEVTGSSVRAGASVALPTLARLTVEAGLAGLEWAVGVPGSVGGAVRMNAGGHGSDTAASLVEAEICDLGDEGSLRTVAAADLHFGYRRSDVTSVQVVTRADFGLAAGDRDRGRAELREIVRWRREHQPGGQNAGSVFTNPPGDSAGRLVEAAGLRGVRSGSATVSPKHANFIQADPGGSADDVYRLMNQVRRRVEAETGVVLETEVRLIGFDGSAPGHELPGGGR